jgi:hypothetical protein
MTRFKTLAGIAALALLVAATAQASDRHKTQPHIAAKAQAIHHDYADVRGFKASASDVSALDAFASDTPPRPAPPAISSFPMPFAVWW